MCDCIKRIEKMLNKKMQDEVAHYPKGEIIESVELQNKAIMFDTGTIQLYSPTCGRYRIGKQNRRFDPSMYFTFCPFCGEKYTSKEEK